MSEIVTSMASKNNMLYGTEVTMKNIGPSCVDNKGEVVEEIFTGKPTEAPVYAVREK